MLSTLPWFSLAVRLIQSIFSFQNLLQFPDFYSLPRYTVTTRRNVRFCCKLYRPSAFYDGCIQNLGTCEPNCTASHPTRRWSWYLLEKLRSNEQRECCDDRKDSRLRAVTACAAARGRTFVGRGRGGLGPKLACISDIVSKYIWHFFLLYLHCRFSITRRYGPQIYICIEPKMHYSKLLFVFFFVVCFWVYFCVFCPVS